MTTHLRAKTPLFLLDSSDEEEDDYPFTNRFRTLGDSSGIAEDAVNTDSLEVESDGGPPGAIYGESAGPTEPVWLVKSEAEVGELIASNAPNSEVVGRQLATFGLGHSDKIAMVSAAGDIPLETECQSPLPPPSTPLVLNYDEHMAGRSSDSPVVSEGEVDEIFMQGSYLPPALRGNFDNLSFSIQYRILCLLPNSSLLAMCQQNQDMNLAALDILLWRSGVDRGVPGSGGLIVMDPSDELIQGLCLALWLTHLERFTFYLSSDMRVLMCEMRGLTRFFERLVSIGEVHLSFEKLDTFLEAGGMIGPVDGSEWRATFGDLLDGILDKQCRVVDIAGGHTLPSNLERQVHVYTIVSSWREAPPWNFDPNPGSRHRIYSKPPLTVKGDGQLFIRSDMENTECLHPIPPVGAPLGATMVPIILPEPGLEVISVASSMLLHPLFFAATFKILQNQSYSITTLHFIDVKTTERLWRVLLTNIHLPFLNHFIFVHDSTTPATCDPTLTPGILANFLSRHPKITHLKLNGVNLNASFPKIETHPLLPNLVSFEANPSLISWVLLFAESYYWNLQDVCITSEHFTTGVHSITDEGECDDYQDFHQAIWCIIWFRRPINLTFRWLSEHGLWGWINSQVKSSCPLAQSRIKELVYICNLTLVVDCVSLDGEKLKVLADFFLMFPSLKCLEIVKNTEAEQVLGDDEFLTKVLGSMTGLCSFAVCGFAF